MFENIGFGELLLIIIVLIVFFGPKRIPDIMQSVGKGMREFKRAMRDVQDEVTKAVEEKPKPKPAEPKQVSQPTPNQELKTDSSTGFRSSSEQSKTEAKS
ncbi:MAG: Sec-independent protein translocase protein TatB [Bacteroidetes bacterium]|nr:Sec-independent protein translocase protein TatB [Bacteroidota bacterium]MCL5737868.1 Sec-independent protein translocase protein TatB [Bacteroidota bacterium]